MKSNARNFDRISFRILAVIDNFRKKSLGLVTGESLNGQDVVIALNRIKLEEKCDPERILVRQ